MKLTEEKNMTKPKGGIRAFVFFVIAVILLPLAAYKGLAVMNNYNENGKDVIVLVLNTVKVGKYKQAVQVRYDTPEGEIVFAEATLNRKVERNDIVKAKVLEDDPLHVYAPPSKPILIGVAVVFGVFFIIGLVMPIMYIHSMKRYNLLKKKGLPTKAKVMSAEKIGDGIFQAVMTFDAETEHGKESRTEQFVFRKCYPKPGEEYHILYVMKKNGKCVCEVIEV